jgi:hypothetical protein
MRVDVDDTTRFARHVCSQRGGCVLSTTSCKGRGLCNVDRNPGRHDRRTGFLPSDRRPTLVKSKDHVRTACIVGGRRPPSCDVVGSSPPTPSCWSLLSAPTGPSPSVVRYDEQVLASASRIHRLSGSVRIHAVPGMARRFGEPRWYDTVCGRVHRVPVRRDVDLNLLQSPAVGLQSVIGQKIVLRTGTYKV